MIWLAASFCLVAVIGSLAYAASRAWRLWRTFRSASRRAGEALGRVTDSAAAAERHATALSANSERLAAANANLQRSLAALAIVRAAAAEPRTAFATLRGVVPRK
jgi:hypothetical protein